MFILIAFIYGLSQKSSAEKAAEEILFDVLKAREIEKRDRNDYTS